MTRSNYQILLYRHDLLDNVVRLLRFLFGKDHGENLSYFKWKYYENPYADQPLGVVALHGDEVVGFRGYFSSKWAVNKEQKKIIVLLPGDTCVHPEHRRKGLSVAMGERAMDAYHSKYRVFLNMSAGGNSVPGYLKMGFSPLMDKVYLSKYSLSGLLRFLMRRSGTEDFPARRLYTGIVGNLEISLFPKPEEMAALAMRSLSKASAPGFSLCKDAAYFGWRYRNKRNRYLFYYSMSGGSTQAYVAVRVHASNRRAYIVDYGASGAAALEPVLLYMAKKGGFDILSIYDLDVEKEFRDLLTLLSFKRAGLLRLLEKRIVGDWPVLVRPVKPVCEEEDWVIHGLDIRRRGSWVLRQICSDGI